MHALLPQFIDAIANCNRTLGHSAIVDEADTPAALRLHHAHEVGILHRRERMVLHAALVQQHVSDEEITVEDRAPVVRERGRGNRKAWSLALKRIEQRFSDRADIALGRAVEGGAILEIDLLRALLA